MLRKIPQMFLNFRSYVVVCFVRAQCSRHKQFFNTMPKENAVRFTTRRAGGPLSPPELQITKCPVQLVDAFREINKRFEQLEKQLTRAITQLALAEAENAKLIAPSQRTGPSSNYSLDYLEWIVNLLIVF